jgi:S-adenosylmethionine:diacylglycerol 3-amino-3-carboxypropyl transferase
MNTFNKYQFLADLQSELLDAVATNQIESEDQVWEIIDQTIDNAVIYYADCFAIIAALNVTNWTRFGRIDSIEFLAASALNEFVQEELNLQDILKVVEQQ